MSSPRNVALIGFMGAGKSAVGRAVARKTGLPVIDLDDRIAVESGMTVAEIFSRLGEAHFRRLETELLRDVVARTGWLLLPGGGIVLREENRRLLRQGTYRIWLRIGAEEVRRRLCATERGGGRPLLGPAGKTDLAGLMARREPHYRECDDVVDVDGRSRAEVVDAVIDSIGRGTSLLRPARRRDGKTLDHGGPEA